MRKRRAFERGNRLRSQIVDSRSLRQRYEPSRVVGPRGAVLVSGSKIVFGGRPEGTVRAWIIESPVPDEIAEVLASVEESSWCWSDRFRALTVLRTLRLDRTVIGSLLGIQTTLVSRLLGLPNAFLPLFAWVDSGRLTVSHMLVIAELATMSEAETWIRRCIAGKWSVRQLRQKLTGVRATSPDLEGLATELGEQLGTEVVVSSMGVDVRVSCAWFGAGDLLGLLQRISDRRGVGFVDGLGSKRRVLDLVLSAREFEAVFGHLLRQQ